MSQKEAGEQEGKKGIVAEFKEFINRGNVIGLAVGVIVGGAFNTIVNTLVGNVINPFISFLTGGSSGMSGLSVDLGGNIVNFGALIGAVINFLITAAVVFAIVKALNKAQDLGKKVVPKLGVKGGGDSAAKAPDEEGATAADEARQARLCPFCREPIAEDATRCPHCTSKLEGYSGE